MLVYILSTMAKLTAIDLPELADKKAKVIIKTVSVDGDVVTRYNEARAVLDSAEEVIEALKPVLQYEGLQAVFAHNTEVGSDTKALISSVNLTDTTSNEVVRFTWTRKNTKNVPKDVEGLFNRVRKQDGKRVNINDYAAWEVEAKFDSSVFTVNGVFDAERYTAYTEALAAVSAQFGVDNPLTCGKVLKPCPDFHDRRWQDFDVETNVEIHGALPTQVNLQPIRPK